MPRRLVALENRGFPSPNGGEGLPHVMETHGGRRSYGETDQGRGAVPHRGVRAERVSPSRVHRPASKSGSAQRSVKSGKVYKGRYISKTCGNKAGEEATPEEQGLGGKDKQVRMEAGSCRQRQLQRQGQGSEDHGRRTRSRVQGQRLHGRDSRPGAGTGTIESKFIFKDCLQPKNEKKKCSTHGKEPGEIETKELVGSARRRARTDQRTACSPTCTKAKATLPNRRNRGSNSNASKKSSRSSGRSWARTPRPRTK